MGSASGAAGSATVRKALIGIPGYPVSAILTSELFLKPLLYRLQGLSSPARPTVRATIKTTGQFGQLDSRNRVGTGLGLATAYGIMRQSGGAIRIESSLGKGTTVSIYSTAQTREQLRGGLCAEAVVRRWSIGWSQ